jgi:hypothetical protein
MVDDRPVVEQAHELHALAKELGSFNFNLPEKFVAGGIIAKLPPSWRNFVTTLTPASFLEERSYYSGTQEIGVHCGRHS